MCVRGVGRRQADRDRVHDFLLRVVDVVVFHLKLPGALQDIPSTTLTIQKLFLCDPNCNHFFVTYGATSPVGSTPTSLPIPARPLLLVRLKGVCVYVTFLSGGVRLRAVAGARMRFLRV